VFLGLNGIVIKSHGGADAEGFAAAIDMGYDMVRYDCSPRSASPGLGPARRRMLASGAAS
jgi:glycerol-3-phosphate acyltransferase PlsX